MCEQESAFELPLFPIIQNKFFRSIFLMISKIRNHLSNLGYSEFFGSVPQVGQMGGAVMVLLSAQGDL